MNTRDQRISPLLAGVIAGVVMFAIVGVMAWININFAAPWPFASTHTLTVETSDADGISVSSDVRINGRLVGQVTGVQARGQVAEVTVHVDSSEWPLPANTGASVRLATLLGSKYIQLEPPAQAAAGSTLADGATIKGGRPVVDFDQILNGFDTKTRESLKDILATGGRAVANQEGVIQTLLPDLADLNQHGQVPTGTLAARDQSLNSILVNLAVTADQLSKSREDLAGVIDNMNRLTGALAQNTDTLRSFINQNDQITITADQVLGNGYAARLASALPRVNTIVHDLDVTFGQLYPQSLSFKQYAANAGLSLVYAIGDATSQSDRDGYWLRQNLEGLDLSNFGIGSPTGLGTATGAPAPAIATPPKPTPLLPPLPTLPPLPLPPLPPLPTPPPLPPVCVLGICVHTVSDGSTATPTASLTSDGTAGSQTWNGTPYYSWATFALWGGT